MDNNEQVAQKSSALPIVAGVASLAIISYLAICGYAYVSNKILSNVEIDNIAVGNLTKSEALTLVSDQLTERLQTTPVTLVIGGWSGIFEGDIVQGETESAVESAYSVGRDNFFTSGVAFLSNLTGASATVSVPLSLNQEGQTIFHALLDEADSTMDNCVVQSTWELDLENEVIHVTKGVSGNAVDRINATTATLEVLSGGETSVVPLTSVFAQPNVIDFYEVQDQIFAEAKSAILDHATLEITPHILGVDLNISEANGLYQSAGEGTEFTIPLLVTQPEQTAEVLQGQLFADVLADVTSRVTGSTARRGNVQLSSQIYNEMVLLPGETFSYYEGQIANPQITSRYGAAPAFVGGETVEIPGGGICQVSSTLYYAILHTYLEVVERSNHGYTIGYVPNGMDATYFGGVVDFKFKNNLDYPIKILTNYYTSSGSNYLNVQIHGTKTDDVTIKLSSTSANYKTEEPIYVVDTSLAVGQSVQKQSAQTGLTATLYRSFYDGEGNLIETVREYTDTYRSRPATIHHNPGEEGTTGETTEGVEPEVPTEPDVPTEPEVQPEPPAEVTPDETVQPEETPDVIPGTSTESQAEAPVPVVPSDSGIVIE